MSGSGPDPFTGPDGPQLVLGVTHDSRRVQPGDLYAALPGGHHHGAQFCQDAASAGAVAVLTDPAGRELRAAVRPARLRGLRPPGEAGGGGVLGLPPPVGPAPADRGDRHERQDHHHLPARLRAAPGRSPDRPDRRGGDPDRGCRGGEQAHHPGGDRPAGPVRDHGRARRHRGGDGGVQPRAGARPGVRHLLRGGHLHQPVPGSPGLPRHPRRVLRGEGHAVHARLRPDGRGEHRRRLRQAARGRRAHPGRHLLGQR